MSRVGLLGISQSNRERLAIQLGHGERAVYSAVYNTSSNAQDRSPAAWGDRILVWSAQDPFRQGTHFRWPISSKCPAGEYPEPGGHGRLSPLRRPGLQSHSGPCPPAVMQTPWDGPIIPIVRISPPIPNRFIVSPGAPQTSIWQANS